MELSFENLAVVSIVASVVTQGLRILASSRFGYLAPRELVNIVLFVISVGLGIQFFGLPVVASGDPMDLAQALVANAAAVFGGAALVYNVLLNKVLLPVE